MSLGAPRPELTNYWRPGESGSIVVPGVLVVPAVFRDEIAAFLRGHRGAICSECIATALALPPRQVAITTLGLDNREGFIMEPDTLCSRCGIRGRVIRALAGGPPSSV